MELDKTQRELISGLYSKMFLPMCIYANNALHDMALSEEVVQDTFRIACMKADKLLESENPQGWLLNTLKNVIHRAKRSQAEMSELMVAALSDAEISGLISNDEPNIDMLYGELLNKDEFMLLKQVAIEGYTIAEAANMRGIAVEACKKRVQRAKRKLKKKIEKIY